MGNGSGRVGILNNVEHLGPLRIGILEDPEQSINITI